MHIIYMDPIIRNDCISWAQKSNWFDPRTHMFMWLHKRPCESFFFLERRLWTPSGFKFENLHNHSGVSNFKIKIEISAF